MRTDDYQHMLTTLDQDIGLPVQPDEVILANGNDLTPEAVRWLWEGWLASKRGKRSDLERRG